MALILVTHDTAAPALYGALAASVAAERGAVFAHLPACFDTALHPDAVQHVAASGVLVPSGLLWFERLTGTDIEAAATVDAVLRDAMRRDVVIPLHPAVMLAGLAEALDNAAEAEGVAVERLAVGEDESCFALRRIDARGSTDLPGCWLRDGFGRFVSATPGNGNAGDRGPPLRVGLIGAERDHREVYPGALAALGDAADHAGLAVDVAFIDPKAVRVGEVRERLAGVDGLLLPGGSDMANVPGQILMARGAFDGAVPTVGLCLGMQTMATALAQSVLGGAGVNLAEADPHVPLHSFVAMSQRPELTPHRLGGRATFPIPGTRYGSLPGVEREERFNHRYRLNIELEPALAAAGARVSARDETGIIADAIEADRHPFFIGLQAHPELRSQLQLPHPVLLAFVLAKWADRPNRITLGAGKGYDAEDFVNELRSMNVTPHIACNGAGRRSALDVRTTRHPGYAVSQRIRKRIEEGFGWGKEFGLLRRIRMRGRERVDMAFAFSAAACKLVRLPKLLAEPAVA